jgi:hypothetical protein
MKTLTISALLGALVALPLILGRRTPAAVPVKAVHTPGERDANVRYDVDDFLME